MTINRLSLLQYQIDPNEPERNLDIVRNAVRSASEQKSNLLILPELFLHGYNYRQFGSLKPYFAPEIIPQVQDIARSNSISLAGTFVEKSDDKLSNTFIYIDERGSIRHSYRKVHLFKPLGENQYFTPGHEIQPFNTQFGCFGAAICYDLRFPEIFHTLTKKGCQLIIICAEWPTERLDHWRILLRARAIENQVFIAAVNCCGTTIRTSFGGNSMFINPWGDVLFSSQECDGLSTVSFDLEDVPRIRAQFPIFEDIFKVRH